MKLLLFRPQGAPTRGAEKEVQMAQRLHKRNTSIEINMCTQVAML